MINEFTDQMRALSEHEKAYIRSNLQDYIRSNPARAPFWIRAVDSFYTNVYSPRLQFAAASLVLVFVAGSGTAFAAQSALPGDALYGVKVNIEEPIQGSFATSAEAQANWNAQLASVRLSEAEQLAAQNKLTPSNASTIAGGLAQATENFDANVAQLATSSSDSSNVVAAATAESNMETTLAANTEALSEIASSVPATAATLKPIIASVEERSVSLNSASAELDAAAGQGNVAQVKAAAQMQLSVAQGQLNQVTSSAASATSSVATPQAQAAAVAIQAGQANLDHGNYVAALETLQTATLEAREAQVNISVDQQLKGAGTTEVSTSTSTVATANTGTATSSAATSTQEDATSTAGL